MRNGLRPRTRQRRTAFQDALGWVLVVPWNETHAGTGPV